MSPRAYMAALAILLLAATVTLLHGSVSESGLRLWADAVRVHHMAESEARTFLQIGQVLPHLIARLLVALPGASLFWLAIPACLVSSWLAAALHARARDASDRAGQGRRIVEETTSIDALAPESLPGGRAAPFLGSDLAPVSVASPAHLKRWRPEFLAPWALMLAFCVSPYVLRTGTDLGGLGLGLAIWGVLFFILGRLEEGHPRAELGFALALIPLVLSEPNAPYLLIGIAAFLPPAIRRHRSYPVRIARTLLMLVPALAATALTLAVHALLARGPVGAPFALWISPGHGVPRLDRLLEFAAPQGRFLLSVLGLLVVGTPFLWALSAVSANFRTLRYPVTACAALLAPVFALYEAGALEHSTDPAPWVAFSAVALLVWLASEPLAARTRLRVAVLSLAASVGGWVLPEPGMYAEGRRWRESLLRPVESTYEEALAASGILSRLDCVVLDEASAFPLIALSRRPHVLVKVMDAARGAADRGHGFDPDAVVVTNPATEAGIRDRMHLLLPGIWRDGIPGYTLALDLPDFRIYRRARGIWLDI